MYGQESGTWVGGIGTAVVVALVLLAGIVAVSGPAAADSNTLTVNKSNSSNFDSIQNAVDSASAGDTIKVKPGTYTEQVDIDKGLTLKSTAGPENTIITKDGGTAVIHSTSDLSGLTIRGFTINGTGGTYGIYLTNQGSYENVTLRNNILNGSGTSISAALLWSLDGTITVANNEFTGDYDGLNIQGDTSSSQPTDLVVTGNTFSGLGDNGAEFNSINNLTFKNNKIENYSTIENDIAAGIEIAEDGDVVGDITVTGNTITGGPLGIGIYPNEGSSARTLDISGNTLKQNNVQIDDKTGMIDTATVLKDNTFDEHVVVNRSGSSLLPTIWGNIQPAVDAAQSGDTIEVEPGTYHESVSISGTDDLTLRGVQDANGNSPVIVGDGANVGSQPHAAIHVDGNPSTQGITIEGLTIRNPDGHYGVYAGTGGSNSNVDGFVLRENTIEDIATSITSHSPLAGTVSGLYVRAEYNNITVEDNTVRNVNTEGDQWQNAVGLSFSSFIGDTAFAGGGDSGSETAENTTVRNNTVTNITGAKSSRTKGIAASGEFDGLTFTNNTITNVSADTSDSDVFGFELTENPPKSGSDIDNDGTNERIGPRNFEVRNNDIDELSGKDEALVFVGGYEDLGDNHVIMENNFRDTGAGVSRFAQDQAGFNPGDEDRLNATRNWWGNASGPSGAGPGTGASVGTDVDFTPWLDAPFDAGGKPTARVENNRTGNLYLTIQNAVDFAQSGDTLLVKASTYDEQVNVYKDLTIEAADGAVLEWTSNPGSSFGANSYLVVDSGASLTLDGLEFQGPFAGSNTAGIFVTDGASLTASNLTMTKMYKDNGYSEPSGAQSHSAIVVGDKRYTKNSRTGTLKLTDSTIDEFGKSAITVTGDKSSATVSDVEVNGSGVLDPNTNGSNPAQDTFLLDGGDLTLTDSTVSDVRYEGSFTAGTGVSVFGPSDSVEVRDNQFDDVAKPISLQSFRSFDNTQGVIEDVVVDDNTITGQFQGLDVFSERALATASDTVVRNLSYTDNEIKDGNTGLAAWTGQVVNSTITDNTLKNNSLQVYQPRGTFNGTQIINQNDLDAGAYVGPPNTTIFTSIQDAIDGNVYDEEAVSAGDTVTVLPGTYTEQVNIGTSITLTSTAGPGKTTITSSKSKATVQTFRGSIDVTIDGFTIKGTGGAAAFWSGAPWKNTLDKSVTLRNNVLKSDTKGATAAYIWGASGKVVVDGNVFIAEKDDGLNVDGLDTVTSNVEVRNNVFKNVGENGVEFNRLDGATFTGNTIKNYSTRKGETAAGLEIADNGPVTGTVTVRNNTITDGATGIGVYPNKKGGTRSVQISKNTISNSSDTGVRIEPDANASLVTVTDNNLPAGLVNENSSELNATRNWWGDASGPSGQNETHPREGTGSAVSGLVDFVPWLDAPTDQNPKVVNGSVAEFAVEFASSVLALDGETQASALTRFDFADAFTNRTAEATFESDDTDVATVFDNGTVVANGSGTATITATVDDPVDGTINASGVITVGLVDQISLSPNASRIAFEVTDGTIVDNETTGFTATATLVDGTRTDVTDDAALSLQSRNTNIATIENGSIVPAGKNVGTVTIEATMQRASTTTTITVERNVTTTVDNKSVSFNETDIVENISFETDDDIDNATVQVAESDTPDQSAAAALNESTEAAASVQVQKAPDISAENESATIEVTVPTNEIANPNEAVILRIPDNGSTAQPLDTEFVGVENGEFVFKAETPDFSVFVVGTINEPSDTSGDAVGGGGGGGGGALFPGEGPEPVVTATTPIIDDTPQTPGTTVAFDNTDAVQRVTFDSENIDSGAVEVSEFAGAPSSIADEVSSQVAADAGTAVDTAGAVDVVKAVEISPTSDTAASSSATVELEVDSDELESPEDAVVVHEVSDGNWETLETSVQTSGGTVTLTAAVDSFSTFAVADLSPAQAETPTPVSTPAPDETPTPSGPAEATPEPTPEPEAQDDTGQQTPADAAVGTDTPAATEEPAGFGLTAGLAVLFLAALLVAVFFLRRRDVL